MEEKTERRGRPLGSGNKKDSSIKYGVRFNYKF